LQFIRAAVNGSPFGDHPTFKEFAMHKSTRVLFLGTANAGRSLMAEALLRNMDSERFEAHSAGIDPTAINQLTLQVLTESGIDVQGLRPKNATEYLGKVHFGYVITVCDWARQNCPTAFLTMGQRLHWTLDDPLKVRGSEEETLAAFRRVRDETEQMVRAWLAGKS
jgi:arsenate reductase